MPSVPIQHPAASKLSVQMKEAPADLSGKVGKTSGRSSHDLSFTGIPSGLDQKNHPDFKQ